MQDVFESVQLWVVMCEGQIDSRLSSIWSRKQRYDLMNVRMNGLVTVLTQWYLAPSAPSYRTVSPLVLQFLLYCGSKIPITTADDFLAVFIFTCQPSYARTFEDAKHRIKDMRSRDATTTTSEHVFFQLLCGKCDRVLSVHQRFMELLRAVPKTSIGIPGFGIESVTWWHSAMTALRQVEVASEVGKDARKVTPQERQMVQSRKFELITHVEALFYWLDPIPLDGNRLSIILRVNNTLANIDAKSKGRVIARRLACTHDDRERASDVCSSERAHDKRPDQLGQTRCVPVLQAAFLTTFSLCIVSKAFPELLSLADGMHGCIY